MHLMAFCASYSVFCLWLDLLSVNLCTGVRKATFSQIEHPGLFRYLTGRRSCASLGGHGTITTKDVQ
jgi:hypothetical protein